MLMAVGMSLTVVSCSSDDDEDFVQEAATTEEVKTFFEDEMNIKPKFHCVLNKGIEDHIQQHIVINKLFER